MGKPFRTFCCYAREDQNFLHNLKKHLISLEREELIIVQADIDISPGTEWEQAIYHHLEAADIILLLVSASFIASDYCFNKEMRRAIARHEQKVARVVPVIIRPASWQSMPFGKLQVLPEDAKPVSTWKNPDEAFLSITEGIRTLVQELATGITVNRKPGPPLWPSAQEDLLPTSNQGRNDMDTKDDSIRYTIENKGPVYGQVIGGQHGQVISGRNIYITNKQKDGIRFLEKGSKALLNGNYPSAKKELRAAVEEIDRDNQLREASKARYFLALAFLSGNLPRIQGRTIMQSIEELMNDAITIYPCASYYRIFACIKNDFFKYNGFSHRLNEVDALERKGALFLRCADDDENEEYFRRCQPRLAF